MNIDDISTELQKFADANNLNLDVSKVLDAMSAGDFVELNSAMDSSDNTAIMKLLQKYKANISENFKLFSTVMENSTVQNNTAKYINSLSPEQINNNYHVFVRGALSDPSHLSLQEMKTLIYEDVSNALSSVSTKPGSQAPNAQTALQGSTQPQNSVLDQKAKQDLIARNANNPAFKVTTPTQGNSTQVQQVLGIDSTDSNNPLVVTKDPQHPDSVDVHSLDDVQPVQEEEEVDSDVDDIINISKRLNR